MTQRDKAEQRIMSNPIRRDITFEEAKNFLLSKGFTMQPGKGDHMKFTHENLEFHLSIPCNVDSLKVNYIKDIRKALNCIN